jgi:hypothetical protein
MLDETGELRALEEAEEPEPSAWPEPTERTMSLLKLTEGFGLTDNLASRCLMTVVLTSSK